LSGAADRVIVVTMRTWPLALLSFAGLAALMTTAACGDRTGLLVPIVVENENPESGTTNPGGDDSGPTTDAGPITDALPPIDVSVPPPFNDCPDAGSTFIYVVGSGSDLYSFYPPMVAFTRIGTLHCPVQQTSANPFSMAVDRTGVAYVLYTDGELFRVSTATAACEATPFVIGQNGFDSNFGMGYSHDNTGTGETLYVIGEAGNLATINTNTFGLRVVGTGSPPLVSAELTGTGGGDLFGFYASTGSTPCTNHACPDSAIGQLDKTSGRQTNQSVLKGVNQGDAWAFAFWGGDFYTFTQASAGGTRVTRFRPSNGSVVTVATRPDFQIVGAGVSTCAPAR
jgi:hypothetical protein